METIEQESSAMRAWLFTRRGRLRVVEYHTSSPPTVGGLLLNLAEQRSAATLDQALAQCRPWVCLGLLPEQPWTRRARVAAAQWLRRESGGANGAV